MPTLIHCPSCRRQLRVPDALAGTRVMCPSCGSTFTATGGVPESPAEPAPVEPVQAAAPEAYAPPPPPPPEPPPRLAERSPEMPPGGRYRLPHRGPLILVLGILSLITGCLGLIFGPIAWSMGTGDLAAMQAGRMDPQGRELTNAGRICGIIGTAISVASLCCCGGWFAGPFGLGRRRMFR
jgi:hypothetical protein